MVGRETCLAMVVTLHLDKLCGLSHRCLLFSLHLM